MTGARPTSARRPVAVVLSRFPSVTETFILREVAEMERQGQPVRLVPLLREDPPLVHPEARPWVRRALYTPFLSPAIVASNVRALLQRPATYLTVLLRLVSGTVVRPRFLLGTLAIVPKSVHLAERLQREGVGHVHAHFGSHPATAAYVIAAFSEIGYSVTIHAHDLFMPRYRAFLGPKLEAADFVRVISAYNREYLMARYPSVRPEKVHVVHVGVDADLYEPREGDEHRAGEGSFTSDGEVRLLSVAGLRPYKGPDVLVEACRRLSDAGVRFRCDLVGEGPLRGALERQIAEAGLEDRVRLHGAETQERIAARFRARPLVVHPSVVLDDGMMDGIPVALMEAMAAGAPVISSRVSGIPELVEDGVTGLLVEPGDPTELAAAVRRLATDPELAHRLGGAATRRVRTEFDLSGRTTALLELIDAVNPRLTDPLGPDVGWRNLGPAAAENGGAYGARVLHLGRDSRVVELLVTGAEATPVVVKVHADRPDQSKPPALRARHEHALLRRFTRSPGPALVPRPLHLDDRAGVVVMEVCRGRRLDDVLRSGRLGARLPERVTDALEQTGDWLARFQALTVDESERSEALRAWRAATERDAERCAAHVPARLLTRVLSHVREGAERVEDRAFIPVGHHGDFWPGNVLVEAEGVRVVDLEGYRTGLAAEDPAYFLIQAELYVDRLGLRRHVKPLRDAFLRGYGDRALPVTEGYRLCRVAACLRALGARSGDDRRTRRLVGELEEALR